MVEEKKPCKCAIAFRSFENAVEGIISGIQSNTEESLRATKFLEEDARIQLARISDNCKADISNATILLVNGYREKNTDELIRAKIEMLNAVYNCD